MSRSKTYRDGWERTFGKKIITGTGSVPGDKCSYPRLDSFGRDPCRAVDADMMAACREVARRMDDEFINGPDPHTALRKAQA